MTESYEVLLAAARSPVRRLLERLPVDVRRLTDELRALRLRKRARDAPAPVR